MWILRTGNLVKLCFKPVQRFTRFRPFLPGSAGRTSPMAKSTTCFFRHDRGHRRCLGGSALALLIAWGCGDTGRSAAPEYTTAAQRAEAGLVAPLAEDPDNDIRSWVDGQTVTDWPAEIAR